MFALLLSLALAAPPAATPLKVRVSRTTSLMLPSPNQQTLCDDPELLTVENSANGVELTGRKVGRTQCSFGPTPSKKAKRLVFDVEVTP